MSDYQRMMCAGGRVFANCKAGQRKAQQSKAPQSTSGSVLNRSPPDVFWNIKRSAPHCKAQHCSAEQGMAKHHGSAICKSRFSGMFSHSKSMLRQLIASPCKASHGKAHRVCISQDALPMRFPHYSNGIPPKVSN